MGIAYYFKDKRKDAELIKVLDAWYYKIIDRVNILKIENNGGQDEH
jgi:hypothetical protein